MTVQPLENLAQQCPKKLSIGRFPISFSLWERARVRARSLSYSLSLWERVRVRARSLSYSLSLWERVRVRARSVEKKAKRWRVVGSAR